MLAYILGTVGSDLMYHHVLFLLTEQLQTMTHQLALSYVIYIFRYWSLISESSYYFTILMMFCYPSTHSSVVPDC